MRALLAAARLDDEAGLIIRSVVVEEMLGTASDTANRTWSRLFRDIDDAFNGHTETLLPAVPAMFKLRDQALVLLANPLPSAGGRHAGPTFEWVTDH